MNEINQYNTVSIKSQIRALRACTLPDIDRVCLKISPDETVPAQIKRHCLHLQGTLFMLSVYCDFEYTLSEDLLETYFMATSDLVHAINHLKSER